MNKAKKTISRNQKHELIMQCIYSKLSCDDADCNVNIDKISENIFKKNLDQFCQKTISETFQHLNEITAIVKQNLVNWRMERISNLAKAILFMSYAHYKYVETINKAIIIDIAIKLAKKYLDVNDYKFINGILDKILI